MNSEAKGVILLPCPFCGREVDEDLSDTLYPTGIGWISTGVHVHYISSIMVPEEQWCWKLVCPESGGGCGAEMHGDSMEEVITKWSRRAILGNKPDNAFEAGGM